MDDAWNIEDVRIYIYIYISGIVVAASIGWSVVAGCRCRRRSLVGPRLPGRGWSGGTEGNSLSTRREGVGRGIAVPAQRRVRSAS